MADDRVTARAFVAPAAFVSRRSHRFCAGSAYGTHIPMADSPRTAPDLRAGSASPPHRDPEPESRTAALRYTDATAARTHARQGRFGDLAEIHDGDPIGEIADDAHVVRDEQVRGVCARLQVAEQVEDRGLNRHVERGDRLVTDDQVGFAQMRARCRRAASRRRKADSAAGRDSVRRAARRATASSPRRPLVLLTIHGTARAAAPALGRSSASDSMSSRGSGTPSATGAGRRARARPRCLPIRCRRSGSCHLLVRRDRRSSARASSCRSRSRRRPPASRRPRALG